MMSGSTAHKSSQWRARGPLMLGFAALLVLVGGLGVWGARADIAGAVIAPGVVQLESNRQVVQHPQGGVVAEIVARDGDHVEAGEVVLRLDETRLLSELAIVEAQLFEILARKSRLEAERDDKTELTVPEELQRAMGARAEVSALVAGQRRLMQARAETVRQELEQMGEQVAQINRQIEGAGAQLAATRAQHDLVGAELADSTSLQERGLMQASRVSALKREIARLAGETGRLEAVIAELTGQISALRLQQLRLRSARREEAITTLRDLEYREMELRERGLALRETQSRLALRSPVSGIVTGSQVFALQAVLSPAQPVMYVIPQDQPYVVRARVDTLHIDQVHVGQAAALRFPTFQRRQTPELQGRVRQISADAFVDDRSGQSFYQADIAVDDGEFARLDGLSILPGMPAEVYFSTEMRTAMSYLTKPMRDYFSKAFRER